MRKAPTQKPLLALSTVLLGLTGLFSYGWYRVSTTPDSVKGQQWGDTCASLIPVVFPAGEENDLLSDTATADVDTEYLELSFFSPIAQPGQKRLSHPFAFLDVIDIAPKQGPPDSLVVL